MRPMVQCHKFDERKLYYHCSRGGSQRYVNPTARDHERDASSNPNTTTDQQFHVPFRLRKFVGKLWPSLRKKGINRVIVIEMFRFIADGECTFLAHVHNMSENTILEQKVRM